MNAKNVVSVLLPVYNGEPFLSTSIESILCQSYPDLEVIIIDDGSTDKSLQTINRYARHDRRIKVIHRGNRGLAATLNEGLELASGKYIARMDADDICESVRFERQYKFLEEHPKVGVLGSALICFGERLNKSVWRPPLDHLTIKSQHIFNSSLYHPTVMMRKSVLDLNKLRYCEEYRHAQDYDLWVRMQRVTEAANLPDVLLHYRRHAGAIGNTSNSKQASLANRTRLNVLTQDLRLLPSESERSLHFALACRNKLELQTRKEDAKAWLVRLSEANRKTGYTSEDAMDRQIKSLEKWLDSPPPGPCRMFLSRLKSRVRKALS